jgi:hypothetical protein
MDTPQEEDDDDDAAAAAADRQILQNEIDRIQKEYEV